MELVPEACWAVVAGFGLGTALTIDPPFPVVAGTAGFECGLARSGAS
jgi:hypothetical protein